MQLECLTRSQLDSSICKLVGKPIDLQPLSSRAETSRHTNAHHKRKCFLELFLNPLSTQVAVILKIGAVKFRQLRIVTGNGSRGLILQTLKDSSKQIVTVCLDVFVLGTLLQLVGIRIHR